MEPGGIRMGSTEGTHSATPKLWHYNSHKTSRVSPLFLAGLGPPMVCGNCSAETIGPGPTTLLSIVCVSVCVSSMPPDLNLKSLQE